MSTTTASKVLASVTALIGAVSVIYALLTAFGVELTSAQQDAITGVLGLVLLLTGIWFHPSIPVPQPEPPGAPPAKEPTTLAPRKK